MDSWTKEQVEVMKSIGNVASNAKYNPNELRHSPPANREDSERDSEMEKYIRSKYEFKRYMVKSSDLPARNEPFTARASPLLPISSTAPQPASKVQSAPQPQMPSSSPQMPFQPISQSSVPANAVWNDLISLSETPAQSTTLLPTSVASFRSTPSSNFIGTNFASFIHTGQPATLVQQGGITGYDPNTFTQQTPAVGASGGLSAVPHPLSYLQQMPLQGLQAPVCPIRTQSSAVEFSQPFQQQGITPQGYALAPQDLTPSPGLQHSFQPFSGQIVDNTFHAQRQPTQTEYSSAPEYNQWTS